MNEQSFFQLTQEAVTSLAERYGTPLLVLSLEQVEKNYDILREHIPQLKIHYAMKANPDLHILDLLINKGACFDVASDGEIRTLSQLGVSGDRMIYANPIKLDAGFAACRDAGVYRMTYDSESEIRKIAEHCPGATVLLRLRIDNAQAHVDLNKKFGCPRERALELMLKAREAGLDVAGIAFHVGSQTVAADPYFHAMDITKELMQEARKAGLTMRVLDIGGGFPIPETGVHYNLTALLDQVAARLREDFSDLEIWAEPGRYMCGTAVNLITRVIGENERNGQTWYFLDDGIYGTFSGVIFDQWDFKLISFKDGKKIPATFAGPSCDSLDIMFRGKMTEPLEVGDVLLVPVCGAYTSASATTFNGFKKAKTVIWEEVREELGLDALSLAV
ncbi:type III PLP-dependent enzyme [Acidaminococcus timonensis]|uniref:type III PLP-dependent enzyme n=1 Tax=Acidaminococcus timonensis TaxID=1871002 RepID=UPI0025EC3DEC|nr:type III PLP-dependent enzyme [Acidaminococcus timonensis]